MIYFNSNQSTFISKLMRDSHYMVLPQPFLYFETHCLTLIALSIFLTI